MQVNSYSELYDGWIIKILIKKVCVALTLTIALCRYSVYYYVQSRISTIIKVQFMFKCV